MPESERDPDHDDRSGLAIRLEQVEAKPAEGQLLRDRPDHGEGEQVESERCGMARLPSGGRQPLLSPTVKQWIQGRIRDRDHDEDRKSKPDRASPRVRAAEREDLAFG